MWNVWTVMVQLAKGVAWNCMLAIVPVVAAYTLRLLMDRRPTSALRYIAAAVAGVVWFVFLPNTCYLLTEWRHFLSALDGRNLYLQASWDRQAFLMLLVGTLFYFMYACFGMITFAMAIRPVERMAIKRGVAVQFWAVPFFVAVSVGVYLGLVLRFNSWELAIKPASIWAAIVDIGGRPLLTAVILAFAAFLWIAYESLDIWFDGLKQRFTKGKSEA